MKRRVVGITRFLGTNCDQDVWQAVAQSGAEPKWLWFNDRFDHKSLDAIVVPGGFSHGDYLRAGALAARMPVMESVAAAAQHGIPILGICNGFQILCEAGLLPGVLTTNVNLRFIDQWVLLDIQASNPHWGAGLQAGARIRLPIAHAQGRYYVPDDHLKKMEDRGMIWLRYVKNPNGAIHDIAGIFNEAGNVAALMPHPERAVFDWMGSKDGCLFFSPLGESPREREQ